MSKHFFIFTYIIAFFLGIVLLTINQIYITKTSDHCYRKLQYYNWAFIAHIAVNFIYFYKLYFGVSWGARTAILFAVNASFIVFMFFTVKMLQEFSTVKISKSTPLLLTTGSLYVIVYSLTSDVCINPSQKAVWNLPMEVFVLSDLAFVGVVAFCCIRLFIGTPGRMDTGVSKALFRIFCTSIFAYAIFNLYVDLSFCFTYQKSYVWNINIYNLTILFYLFLNILSIPMFYRRETFINAMVKMPEAITETSNHIASVMAFAEKHCLTDREKEVLELINQGKSNPDISRILFISNYTVKRHVNNIFRKTGVKSRFELLSKIKNQ